MNHVVTDHVLLITNRCTACGSCIETCPKGVLGQVEFLKHKHSHVDRADLCAGCLKCVQACPQKAILARRNLDKTDTTLIAADIPVRRKHPRGHRTIISTGILAQHASGELVSELNSCQSN